MKKYISLFITLFIFIFALTSCDNKKDNNDDNKTIIEPTALIAPSISSNDNIISWNKIDNAKGYVVNVDGVDQAEQTATSYEVTSTTTKTFKIKVKAIGDGTNYKNSEYSNELSIEIKVIESLNAPVISLNDNVITWDAVDNATSYVVNINGIDDKTLTSTSYNFESSDYGLFKIKVKSINGNIQSNYSNEVEIGIYEETLLTPTISNEDHKIVWNSVRRANKYIVNINGEDLEPTEDLSYDYDELPTAIYKFKVKAIDDNYEYGPSNYSNEIEIDYVYEIKLDTPQIKLNTDVITWDAVNNATSYVVYYDGVELENITTNYYQVTDKNNSHRYKFKAISSNARYLDSEISKEITTKFSKNGFLDETTGDFSKYENTEAYVQVSTAKELLTALMDARYDYTSSIVEVLENKGFVVRNNVRKNESNWKNALNKGLYLKNEDGTYFKIPVDTPFSDTFYTNDMVYYEDSPYNPVSYTQSLTKAGTVHVIEIMNDIDLGYKKLSSDTISVGGIASFKADNDSKFTKSKMYEENGMSQITITRCYDLLIYSKNGAKLTHGGFKLESSNKVCIRNLEFDELWQWEDTSSTDTAAVGDMDAYGWAYFKINNSDEIWIDHCTFGKAYDGIIDISDPTFTTMGTLSRAPYLTDGTSDVHISYCNFNTNSDNTDGYVYKMMQDIEADYQAEKNNYLYYKALRDAGYEFEEILYGIAIPHKKAFLICDGTDSNYENNKDYNENLKLSIAYCKFIDIEDRIPKVRSANAYLYGNVIDNSRYYSYLQLIKSKNVNGTTINAKSVVAAVNSSWKCAGVSHGVLVSQDGSAYVYGCIFKGISNILSNNDFGKGGFIIENTRYVNQGEFDYTGSTSDENNEFIKHKDGSISTEYFFWINDTNSIPFYVEEIDLTELETKLASNAGIQLNFENGLKNPYTI